MTTEATDKVLSPQELEDLMKVPTTVDEAEQIKERNERLLELLEKDEYGVVLIGCPHCGVSKDIGTTRLKCRAGQSCAWDKHSQGQIRKETSCVRATFGGISLNVAILITYGCNEAEVRRSRGYKEKYYNETKTFLLGHIEWAEAVIEAGGVS